MTEFPNGIYLIASYGLLENIYLHINATVNLTTPLKLLQLHSSKTFSSPTWIPNMKDIQLLADQR
jgi:hypothetical protein